MAQEPKKSVQELVDAFKIEAKDLINRREEILTGVRTTDNLQDLATKIFAATGGLSLDEQDRIHSTIIQGNKDVTDAIFKKSAETIKKAFAETITQAGKNKRKTRRQSPAAAKLNKGVVQQ